jgi:hypothetical protein
VAGGSGVFAEAADLLRLLRGDARDDDVAAPELADHFRADADWERVREPPRRAACVATIRSRVASSSSRQDRASEWRRACVPVIGSHDPRLQEAVNRILPVQVFNLSITRPDVIEDTHRRMALAYHPDGGSWQRRYMPRTVMVFLNEEPHRTAADRRARARDEARAALAAYWTALEGTLDPAKVDAAADNAVIGNADDVASQIVARYHPEYRLMLWFDFFNHDSERVGPTERS